MLAWLVRRWYDGFYWVAFFAYTFGWSLRVAGRRNVPMTGPAVLVCNHQSFLDPLLVGLSCPRYYITTLARQTLFRNPILAAFIRSFGGVPIDNKGLGRAGLQTVLDALARGEAVVVYPEGERTHDGTLQPFQPGVSLLIKRVKAPIIPVGIAGTFEAWPRQRKYPRPAPLFLRAGKGTLGVVIGKPIDPGPLAEMPREALLAELHVEVAKCVEKAERLRRHDRGGRPTS